MAYTVRCPVCRNTTRVDLSVVGATTVCRRCESPFRAVPEARVRSAYSSQSNGGDTARQPTGLLLGLTLVPFGLPLLWILAPLVTNSDPIFSVNVAAAIAICVSGLGLGVVLTRDWSAGTRVKSLLVLIALAYGSGALLFGLKKDWIEILRRQVGRGDLEWREFSDGKKTFHVRLPGRAVPAACPLPEWTLDAVRVVEKNSEGARDTFLVAYGLFPKELDGLREEEWFSKVKLAVSPDAGEKLTAEKTVSYGRHPGREYRMVLPDGGTNRIVRVYRVRSYAYLLLVEGAFLPMDHTDVKKFFDSFYLEENGK